MTHALTYPRLREIIGTRVVEVLTENGHAIFLKNTNKLLWSEDDLVGGKTGYTRRARHCFVGAAERGDSKVIVAVLGSPNRKTLWKESEKLIHEGFEVMTNGKNPFIYSGKRKDGEKGGFHKKHTKYQEKTLKANDDRKMVAKKTARYRKSQIERKHIETMEKSRDKREKNYRIAEKRKINNKG
jgi:D-alanyl-D-alanine carboxypeptidase (penicillin-binding protein 5/6)